VLRFMCMLQPASASARSKGTTSRNSTDLSLLQGQESSTSGLDRMSSTQVSCFTRALCARPHCLTSMHATVTGDTESKFTTPYI